LRNFTVSKAISDSVLTGDASQVEIARIVAAMRGFVSATTIMRETCRISLLTHYQITHLNSIVMPDPGQDDSSDEEEEDSPEDDDEEEDAE
jgi:hypothetical protein